MYTINSEVKSDMYTLEVLTVVESTCGFDVTTLYEDKTVTVGKSHLFVIVRFVVKFKRVSKLIKCF